MRSLLQGRVANIRHAVLTLSAIGGALAAAACFDLEVNNPNNLNLDNVYNNASNAEAALIGGWRRYWAVNQGINGGSNGGTCHYIVYPVWGNEFVTSSTGLANVREPREAIDNVDNLQCVNRSPWYDDLAVTAAGRDVYQGIETYGLKFGAISAATPDGADTPRIKIFAKFLVAIAQLQLGLRFDQAFTTDVKTNIDTLKGSDLKPYPQVIAHAIGLLREVIADARAAPDFTTPTGWVQGRAITRDELIRICMAYIIRGEVYSARNPQERAAVNWALVLAQTDSTIIRDFAQQSDPAIARTQSPYLTLTHAQNNVRINNRLIGPADTTGRYQTWLTQGLAGRPTTGPTYATPDRRIHGVNATTKLPDPTVAGTYFTRLTTNMNPLINYMTSAYRGTRYLNAAADSGTRSLKTIIPLEEIRFIKAEALYRLNRGAEAAALINITRVPAGLQPATASGPPPGGSCVPRKDDGSCGDLFDAIQYEKRIVLFGTEPDLSWYDARGWGKLLPGTPIHVPVSGRELVTYGLPLYTFGGSGPGSAPAGPL